MAVISEPSPAAVRATVPKGNGGGPTVADTVTELAGFGIDDGARAVARLRLADTLFATAVGSRTEQGRRSAQVGDAVFGHDSVAGRAFRLAAACRMTEIDDIDLLSCTTPGSIVVPTLMAVLASPEFDLGGREVDRVLDAVVVGYEVALGLGESMAGPARLAIGVWPSLVIAPVVAAVVTTGLLGGSHVGLEQAAVLASEHAVHGNPRGAAREHLFATAVATGIGSALAVRRGFVVESRHGGGALGRLLGSSLSDSEGPRIRRPAVKGFCSARQAMTAVAALQEILEDTAMTPDTIDHIDVEVPHQYASMLDKPRVRTRRDSISSAPYQLALAVCDPARLHDVDRTELHTDDLSRVMATVRVRGSDTLSELYPRRWPARVEVHCGGTTHEATAELVPGEEDLSTASLTAKMERFATGDPSLSTTATRISALTTDAVDVGGLLDLIEVTDGGSR